MREEIKNWWEEARDDLKTAEYNLKGGRLKAAAFYSQQAVEKGLKALYIKRFKKLWKIHDLAELGRKLKAPNEILDACVKISPAYIDTRYPGVATFYTKEKVEELLKLAKKVLKWIEKNL
ncbi:MAG: HEPN domain-containing protein [Candidatus Thermoplasmatota archaeon]